MKMNCNKKSYSSFTEAEKALKFIKSDPGYKSKEKKEKRAYKCPFCGKVHLTSISQRDNDLFKNEMQDKRESRVERAADYWENKLGIKDNEK